MNQEERLNLAAAWLRGQERDSTDDHWAVMELQDLVAENPDEAWEVLPVLIDQAINDWQLTMIGSAPLEDLLDDYGGTYFDQLERVLTNRDKWAIALQQVWISDPMKKERIRTLIDVFQAENSS